MTKFCMNRIKECCFFASNLYPRRQGGKLFWRNSFFETSHAGIFLSAPPSINGLGWGETGSPVSSSGRWAEKEIGERMEGPELGTFMGYFLPHVISAWLTNADRKTAPIKTKHRSHSLRVENRRTTYVLKIIWWKALFFRNSILKLLITLQIALLIISCSF